MKTLGTIQIKNERFKKSYEAWLYFDFDKGGIPYSVKAYDCDEDGSEVTIRNSLTGDVVSYSDIMSEEEWVDFYGDMMSRMGH